MFSFWTIANYLGLNEVSQISEQTEHAMGFKSVHFPTRVILIFYDPYYVP
jgi:hypothetical protein